MELKQALKDYTQQEFSTLLSQIWTVRTDKAQHDKMIRHFDEIVDLSEGADLLFYPKADDFGNTFYSGIDRVISHIITAYYQQGKTAFKDDILPEALSHATRTTSFNAQDHAIKKALQAEVKSQKIISRVNETLILTQEALDHFERLLKNCSTNFLIEKSEQFTLKDFLDVGEILSSLEVLRDKVIRSFSEHSRLKSDVSFALRIAALSSGQKQASQDIWIAAHQRIREGSDRHMAELARLEQRHAELHTQAQEVFRTVEKQQLRIAKATHSGPTTKVHTYFANIVEADNTPRILTLDPSKFSTYTRPIYGLDNAVQSAVAGMAWERASSHASLKASVVTFDFERPGCGDPFAITLPLESLIPIDGRDWHYLAESVAVVTMPFRIATGMTAMRHGSLHYGLANVEELAHAYVVSTNGVSISSEVRVLPAVWNSEQKTYRCICPGSAAKHIIWGTDTVPKEMIGPVTDTDETVSHGYLSVSRTPVLEELEIADEIYFNDVIIVFPEDTGRDPVYAIFKSNSEYPGIASGDGKPAAGNWLTAQSSPVPSLVAGQLRGKVFKRFSQLREAIWKLIAAAPELCMELSEQDLSLMQNGHPPTVAASQNSQPATYALRLINSYNEEDFYNMDSMMIIKTTV
ncbi:S-type pyocin domain-containing protein [Pseudomonas coronafaciens]|uniref:S-type pyocin domain-containing protein n=1 Tax=Pseudomonas coronafaciens TaxID=53409 RepID=UPI000EFF396B|nr:S-type pyocin domain-containing protein [Pseudomonas coronafaciens]RMP25209.1 hypothetical protein ALQ25_01407 [Pseudomonas coronafaciens pv. atropurpurea]